MTDCCECGHDSVYGDNITDDGDGDHGSDGDHDNESVYDYNNAVTEMVTLVFMMLGPRVLPTV